MDRKRRRIMGDYNIKNRELEATFILVQEKVYNIKKK